MRSVTALAALLTACSPVVQPTRPVRPEPITPELAVIDGDTIQTKDGLLHVAGIDAPGQLPDAACWAEAALGERAAGFLRSIVNAGGDLAIRRVGEDRYGRALVIVTISSRSSGSPRDLADVMVASGLAARTDQDHWDWCGRMDAKAEGAPALTPFHGPLGDDPDMPSAY